MMGEGEDRAGLSPSSRAVLADFSRTRLWHLFFFWPCPGRQQWECRHPTTEQPGNSLLCLFFMSYSIRQNSACWKGHSLLGKDPTNGWPSRRRGDPRDGRMAPQNTLTQLWHSWQLHPGVGSRTCIQVYKFVKLKVVEQRQLKPCYIFIPITET